MTAHDGRRGDQHEGQVVPGSRWVGGGKTIVVLPPSEARYPLMFPAIVESGRHKGERVHVPLKEFGTRLALLEAADV